MTPAEELRAAAAKLREMAAVATPGPWTLVKNIQEHTSSHMQSTWSRPGKTQAVKASQHDDYAWVVLLGPDKAELLAVWLETEAHCLGVGEVVGEKTADLLDAIAGQPLELSVTVVADTSIPALAFARAILGGVA